jgi:hypothetical protein
MEERVMSDQRKRVPRGFSEISTAYLLEVPYGTRMLVIHKSDLGYKDVRPSQALRLYGRGGPGQVRDEWCLSDDEETWTSAELGTEFVISLPHPKDMK